VRPLFWAFVAFATYVALSLTVGIHFPFSTYPLYADSGGRQAGAVPLFLADGRAVEVRDFVSFQGIDPDSILPAGIACSTEYRVEEARQWLRHHGAPAEASPGPVAFEVGYRIARIDDQRRIVWSQRIVASGTARRAR
jgi:hypothetical protein